MTRGGVERLSVLLAGWLPFARTTEGPLTCRRALRPKLGPPADGYWIGSRTTRRNPEPTQSYAGNGRACRSLTARGGGFLWIEQQGIIHATTPYLYEKSLPRVLKPCLSIRLSEKTVELLHITQRRAVTETEQAGFQFSQPAKRAPVFRYIGAEEHGGLVRSRPSGRQVQAVQHVAYDGDPIFVPEQDNVSRRMPRGVSDTKPGHFVTLVQDTGDGICRSRPKA